MIKLTCAVCGKKYSATNEQIGRLARCRECGGELVAGETVKPADMPPAVPPVGGRPRGRAGWLALTWTASVVVSAAFCWFLAYRRGFAEAKRAIEPVQVFIDRPAPPGAADGLVAELRARLDEANAAIADLSRAKDRAARDDIEARDACALAERELSDRVHLISPLWLRGEYRIHRKPTGWIIDGAVLEDGHGGGGNRRCFWGVEIVRAPSWHDEPYFVAGMVFDGALSTRRDPASKWVYGGWLRFREGRYLRWDYEKLGFPTGRDLAVPEPAAKP